MSDEFDFDYQPPVQTESAQQPTTQYAPTAQAQPVQQPVSNAQAEQSFAVAVSSEVPDLRKGKLSVIPIGCSYWTPKIGDFKFGLVRWIEDQIYEKMDKRTDEVTEESLPTLIFAEQLEDLSWNVISNASKKLVGDIEMAIKNGTIIPNKTGVYIRYLGKADNKKNGYQHDNFEIRIIE